jgi:Holliday junction DNA helicase RuvA
MIGYLSGKIIEIERDGTVILENTGIGYLIHIPKINFEKIQIGENKNYYIHTHVREDALDLFGFNTATEKKIFLLLTSVSGIGPKTAMQILSQVEGLRILDAIVMQDKAALTAIKGIGKKTVERIFIECLEKARELYQDLHQSNNEKKTITQAIPAQGAYSSHFVLKEAVDALVALGYKDAEAWTRVKEVISEAGDESPDLQKIIRKSLQKIATVR